MARSPLIIDTPIGRLYCVDLGGGAAMLMIEQDGQAQTFPIDAGEAGRLARYLRPLGRPTGAVHITEEELQRVADLYTSDAAAAHNGSKAEYVAEQLGVTTTAVYSRLNRAKKLGMVPDE